MTKLSIVLWFRVSHCETPGGGRGNLLRGMQRAMICLLSMEEITSSAAPPRNDSGAVRETASLRYTPLAVTTCFVIANRALRLSKWQ